MENRQSLSAALDRLLGERNARCDAHILLQDTVRTLSNLDDEHRYEMNRLHGSKAHPALKQQIAGTLARRHQTRRMPYAALIAELRTHISRSSAAQLEAAE